MPIEDREYIPSIENSSDKGYAVSMYSRKIPLLREYGEILSGARQRFSSILYSNDGKYMDEHSQEEKLHNTLFLFDFVFRKMYKIPDFNEACRLAACERKKYIVDTHLGTLLDSKNIYIYRRNGRRHIIKNEKFALYLVYNRLDPMRDIIKCYDYLIEHGYKGRGTLIMERDEIMCMMNDGLKA